MTEERFTVPIKYRFSHSKVQLNGEPLTNDELVRILNTNDGAFVENFFLKQENEQLKKENKRFKVKLDSDAMSGCKDYGLKCLKCSYWNKWSRYCTKWKIRTETRSE